MGLVDSGCGDKRSGTFLSANGAKPISSDVAGANLSRPLFVIQHIHAPALHLVPILTAGLFLPGLTEDKKHRVLEVGR